MNRESKEMVVPIGKDVEDLLGRLAASPGRFASVLSRLDDAALAQTAGNDWSAAQVFAHVRAANDILEQRIYYVLVRDNTPLLAYDDRVWAEVARYANLPVTESLNTMKQRRKELVHMLRGISQGDWQRTGTHEVRGPMTVFELASYVANHDEEHIAQLEALIER
ncbi:MAG TPA: DinB family protein [Chloroflexia bacterium]|nr:DinB family protein [Chloroflexia bacterium]